MPNYYDDQNNLLGRRPAQHNRPQAVAGARWWVLLLVLLAWAGGLYLMMSFGDGLGA